MIEMKRVEAKVSEKKQRNEGIAVLKKMTW